MSCRYKKTLNLLEYYSKSVFIYESTAINKLLKNIINYCLSLVDSAVSSSLIDVMNII